MDINGVVLCAGKGTRMQSDLPKVVQKVCEYEMVNLVLKGLVDAEIKNNHLILGYKKDIVIKSIDSVFDYKYGIQEEQLGTGDALRCLKDKLEDKDGITLVTYGDTPLVKSETYKKIVDVHIKEKNDITILTSVIDDATGYGRIIRENDKVKSIVEQKDANDEQKKIKEFNTGIYCFDNKKLFKHLEDITNNNVQNEYYLTDLVEIFDNNGFKIGTHTTYDYYEVMGVNDLIALNEVNSILKLRINNNHIKNGVNIIDINNTYIGPNVIIKPGTTIEPNNYIYGKTIIESNNHIRTGNNIKDTTIKSGCIIGPNARFRENVVIGEDCRIGNFVELKGVTLGKNVKAAHLTYIGDAVVGDNVNFGCGVITANYDGVNKHKTVIGNNAFIGSNTILVAPIVINDDVFIAAGTTVGKDVEKNSFVIDRNELRIKPRR